MIQADKIRTIAANMPSAIGTAVFERAGVKCANLRREAKRMGLHMVERELWRLRG